MCKLQRDASDSDGDDRVYRYTGNEDFDYDGLPVNPKDVEMENECLHPSPRRKRWIYGDDVLIWHFASKAQ